MTDDAEEQGWATAKTLAEALPYIQIYDREVVTIKYGGHAMGEESVAKLFAADAVLLKMLGEETVQEDPAADALEAARKLLGGVDSAID